MALATDDQAPAAAVDGVVTLHGKVDTQADKAAAVKTAEGIEGVRSVVDLLQVVPPAEAEVIEETDEKIEERVTTALDTPELEGSDIDVQSVNKGVVLIDGKADSFTDHLQAVLLVAETPGMRRVSSEVEAPASPTDDEPPRGEMRSESAAETAKNKLADAGKAVGGAAKRTGEAIGDTAETAGSATKEAGRDAAGVARDMWITAATKTKLMANDETPALKINVETHDGEVTLFGTVPSLQAKSAAEQAARSVDGVKTVHNELVVKSDEHAAATQ
jgi:osmotically-inducible protein OsmY